MQKVSLAFTWLLLLPTLGYRMAQHCCCHLIGEAHRSFWVSILKGMLVSHDLRTLIEVSLPRICQGLNAFALVQGHSYKDNTCYECVLVPPRSARWSCRSRYVRSLYPPSLLAQAWEITWRWLHPELKLNRLLFRDFPVRALTRTPYSDGLQFLFVCDLMISPFFEWLLQWAAPQSILQPWS